MPKLNPDQIIGKSVKYFDFIGCERFGRIVFIEPYPQDPEQVYVYIEDDDMEFNTNIIVIADRKPVKVIYAEIRLSSEVYIDG